MKKWSVVIYTVSQLLKSARKSTKIALMLGKKHENFQWVCRFLRAISNESVHWTSGEKSIFEKAIEVE